MNNRSIPQLALACVLAIVLCTGQAFASKADAMAKSQPSANSPTVQTPSGVTGTDPEPIEPNLVSLILFWLSFH